MAPKMIGTTPHVQTLLARTWPKRIGYLKHELHPLSDELEPIKKTYQAFLGLGLAIRLGSLRIFPTPGAVKSTPITGINRY